MGELTHLGPDGAARMVDVGEKPVTARVAIAGGSVTMEPATLERILAGGVAKGEVLQVARVAGIMAAKRTGDLIPLCHPLGLDQVQVDLQAGAANRLDIFAGARVTGRTGIEMEALTAVSVAALTVYDMCKAVDRGMAIGGVRLLLKVGGKSSYCKMEGRVVHRLGDLGASLEAGATWSPTPPRGDGPALSFAGLPGGMVPADVWLIFRSGHRARVVDGGATLEFEAGGPPGLPPEETPVTARLGDRWG